MPYIAKRRYKDHWPSKERAHGPAWPEPLIPAAPRLLAMAVVGHAITIDMCDPRRTLGLFHWVLSVVPADGPLVERKLLPKAIARAEAVLRGDITRPPHSRYDHRLPRRHRVPLQDLIAKVRAHLEREKHAKARALALPAREVLLDERGHQGLDRGVFLDGGQRHHSGMKAPRRDVKG